MTDQRTPGRPRMIIWLIVVCGALVYIGLIAFSQLKKPTRFEELWSVPATSMWDAPILLDGRLVFRNDRGDGITCCDLDGKVSWEIPFNGLATCLFLLDNKVFCEVWTKYGEYGDLYIVDPDGNLLSHSTVNLDEAIRETCVIGDSLIYSDNSNHVRAVDSSFNERWAFPVPEQLSQSLSVDHETGHIYLGLWASYKSPNQFYCLHSDGTPAWQYDTAGRVDKPPICCEDRVFLATMQGLLALTTDGALAWEAFSQQEISDLLSATGETLICATDDGVVHCLDFQGNVRWDTTVVKARKLIKYIICRLAILPSRDLVAFDTYSIQPNVVHYMLKGPAVQHGVKVGGISLIDPASGNVLWQSNLPSPAYGPPLIGPDGTIYVICHDSKLHALRIPEYLRK